ncbi:MAG: PTS IIA-like nitrogen regulatory protein PtsN [Azoarcus sp.]|jgi:PTS system nitrogen regulatory IIA component|nr:PTS IIA-like nitrogen regulatory protein PtsN [Azoarcus sp.]
MSLIASLLPAVNVVAALDAGSKKRVFEEAGMLFESQLGLARDLVFDKLFTRERLGSTGLGQGVAIPHSRLAGLAEAAGAFIRLSTPIPFDAPDGRPVNLVFVLLVPEEANDTHLQLLSELARMFSDRAFRGQLLAAPDAAALHTLLTDWKVDPESGAAGGAARTDRSE